MDNMDQWFYSLLCPSMDIFQNLDTFEPRIQWGSKPWTKSFVTFKTR